MSLIRGLLEGRTAPPGSYTDPSSIPSNASLSLAASGVNVTERSALALSAVWACVSLISDVVSTLPVAAYRKAGDRRLEVSPTPQLLEEPSAGMDWQEWTGRLMVSLLLRGNAFGVIVSRDHLQRPTDILPVHPDVVYVWRDRQTGRITYKILGEQYDPFDIMHIKGMTLPGAVQGLSPLEFARQTIGLGLATQEFGNRYFSEGTSPSGVLETQQEFTVAAAKSLQATWESTHNNRSRRPAVLSGGLQWKPISITPEESQFLATRSFQVNEIARWYHVPPHLVAEVDKTTSWGRGIEEQGKAWVSYGLLPWITRIEKKVSTYLPQPQYMRSNVAGLLRATQLERYQSYLMGRNGGWLVSDEIRALEEMPPLPEGVGGLVSQPLNVGVLTPQGVVGPITPTLGEPNEAPVLIPSPDNEPDGPALLSSPNGKEHRS